MTKKSTFTQKSMKMAFATMLSRVLGFLRVILASYFIGGGVYMTAWVNAFKLPNLFRRLLGEGALGTTLIPIIRHSIEKEGMNEARKTFSTIFIFLSIFLSFICVIIALLSLVLGQFAFPEQVNITLKLIPILIPYALFICLTGISSSVLNSLGQFFKPALAALMLNICFIVCFIILGPIFFNQPNILLNYLAIGVLIAGVLQLFIMLFLLKKENMFPSLKISNLRNSQIIKDVFKISLPGMIGAGALQISLLIDVAIANCLGENAVPALEYSERLVYLPIGVFAVSVGAVALSNMSRFAAQDDYENLIKTMVKGIKLLLFLCIPIVAFLLLCGKDTIELLFMRGKFGETELNATSYALLFYALGIPFFATTKVVVGAFYSRKNMITPLKVSCICIAINIILNLILMIPLKQGGIALATVISSVFNNLILFFILKKEFDFLSYKNILKTLILNSIFATIAIFCVILYSKYLIPDCSLLLTYIQKGIIFVGIYGLFGVLYKKNE